MFVTIFMTRKFNSLHFQRVHLYLAAVLLFSLYWVLLADVVIKFCLQVHWINFLLSLFLHSSTERLPYKARCKLQLYHISFLLRSFFLAYFLGMILTFIVMLLSGMGQPALLYLVPFTVITSAVVAGCRGEMKQFWAGTTYQVRGGEGELYWRFSIIPKKRHSSCSCHIWLSIPVH